MLIETLQAVLVASSIIFLMELGDKTQLASFALSIRFQSPGRVFAGVMTGLVLVSVSAVIIGTLIRDVISENILTIATGVVFVIIGVITILTMRKDQISSEHKEISYTAENCLASTEHYPKHKEECVSRLKDCPVYIQRDVGKNAFMKSFMVISATEIGDKTWITSLVMTTQLGALVVLIGAIIAFTIVNGSTIILGQRFAERISKDKLNLVVGGSLLIVGITMIGLQCI